MLAALGDGKDYVEIDSLNDTVNVSSTPMGIKRSQREGSPDWFGAIDELFNETKKDATAGSFNSKAFDIAMTICAFDFDFKSIKASFRPVAPVGAGTTR